MLFKLEEFENTSFLLYCETENFLKWGFSINDDMMIIMRFSCPSFPLVNTNPNWLVIVAFSNLSYIVRIENINFLINAFSEWKCQFKFLQQSVDWASQNMI